MSGIKKKQEGDVSSETRKKPRSDHKGVDITSSKLLRLDRVSPAISSEDFFEKYIAARIPCILTGLPMKAITTHDILQVAGEEEVVVEKRPNNDAVFGQNRVSTFQITTTVRDFIENKLAGNDKELYYLSTQNISNDDEVAATPCKQLLDSKLIPPTLPLAGNLRLQTCNMWLGSSSKSSSGLHHDFHDNFYCLMAGQKQIMLYSPDHYKYMELHGQVETLHSNGLISYSNNPTTPEGIPLSMLDDGEIDGVGNVDNDVCSRQSDEDDAEEAVLGNGFGCDNEADDESDDFNENKDDYDELIAREEEESESCRPDNFSKIDLTRPGAEIVRNFPEFSRILAVTVDLEAGECLYIPASWFHNVTSSATSDLGNIHLALNYWFYPPSNLHSVLNPYDNNVW